MGDEEHYEDIDGLLEEYSPEGKNYDLNRWVIAEIHEDPKDLEKGEIAEVTVYILQPRRNNARVVSAPIRNEKEKQKFLKAREISRKKTYEMFFKY